MVVQHNMQAANAGRQLNIVGGSKKKSIEKLSSGYKINRAADDAAGLSISEKMRWQARGLEKASINARDGVSFIQTAEGALSETHSMLDRMKELMTQAANDTNTPEDRKQIQTEIDQLTSELDRVSSTTKFNTLDCFSKDGIKPDDIGNQALSLKDLTSNGDGTYSGQIGDIQITYEFIDSNGNKVNTVENTSAETGVKNNFDANATQMANDIVTASSYAVGKLQANFPTLFQSGSTGGIKVGLNLANIDGKGTTLASAELKLLTKGQATSTIYTMNVDTTDYPPGSYDSTRLRATVAHEMTHIVMDDTLTNRMINKGNSFPKWFVEGMAQTTSGDNGWLTLNSSSTDADIKNYSSQLSSKPYGAGYLASMYMGYKASGSGAVNSASIRSGLDKILSGLTDNTRTFDDVIKNNTSYQSLADFQNGVINADSDFLQFTKDFIKARGANGAGSLSGELSESLNDIFGKITPLGNNYDIDINTTQYQNNVKGNIAVPPANPSTKDAGNLLLQVGALSGQVIKLHRFDVSADALLGGEKLDCTDNSTCGHGMSLVEDAIERTSKVRSYYGSVQNRLEHTMANLDNTSENTTAAESRIRDTDMAKEMVFYSMQSILQQAGQSMLAQANQINQGVLSLLR